MKSMSLALASLFAFGALATGKDKPTYARLMMWEPGQRIEYGKCDSYLWEISAVRMRLPRGDEKERPPATLELTIRDKARNQKATYEVTVAQALNRGYSLEGLRFRLTDKGWGSVLAIEIVDGRLNDFVLKPDCEIQLEKQEEAEARARRKR